MKGLLHSKVFRTNLYKWLFMYIGVLGLLTTVITYSKYISSLQSDDTARVAKFNVYATYDGVCSGSVGVCDNGDYRPTNDISYYFTIDTTDLEVYTLLVTNITIKDSFTNIKLYEIVDGVEQVFSSDGLLIENNKITITEKIKINENYIRKYKLVASYDSSKTTDPNNLHTHSISDAVVIGYSATQIK